MKRVLGLLFAVALIFGMVSSASALYFEDEIDYFYGLDIVPIVEGIGLTYQHDINQEVGPNYDVEWAELCLDFDLDLTDAYLQIMGVFVFDFREFTFVQYDGSGWQYVDEVDNDNEYLTVGIDWLNDDGLLDVSIQVYNYAGNPATAYLDKSKLYGCAKPVPEPSTMLLLGAGLLGVVAYGRKRMKK